jgi:putative ABC transport system permease protein
MPRWLHRLLLRLHAALSTSRDRDTSAEIDTHLKFLEEEYVSAGLERDEAARRARVDFGDPRRIHDLSREIFTIRWLQEVPQDIGFACRLIRRSPGWAIAAVLSLAIGIGANAAIFTLIDAVLLRPLPAVHAPDELVQLVAIRNGTPGYNFSYPLVRALAQRRELFNGLAGFTSSAAFNIGRPGSPEIAHGVWVTGLFYQTLGLTPAIGRLLAAGDDREGSPPVVVLSHAFWARRFGGSPDIVGRTMLVEGVPVVVVGVSPPGFDGATVGELGELTMPFGAMPALWPSSTSALGAGSSGLRVLARPVAPRDWPQLKVRTNAIWPTLVADAISPDMKAPRERALASSIDLIPGGTGWMSARREFRLPLRVLMGGVALLLLIACGNVANLLLAQGDVRQREMSLRLALGADRARLARQLFTEGLMLAIAASAIAIGCAWLVSHGLVLMISSSRSAGIILDVSPNLRVLAFTAVLAVGSTLAFNLIPALRTIKAPGLRVHRRLAGTFVVAQMALTLVLMVASLLFFLTLRNLRNLDKGFAGDGILLVDVDGVRAGRQAARAEAFYRDLVTQVERVPGVASASFGSTTPLGDVSMSQRIRIDGEPLENEIAFNNISPGYFHTLTTAILSGRDFEERDLAKGSPPVVIVNATFAHRYLAGRDALAESLTIVGPFDRPRRIVGVVQDAVYGSLRDTAPPTVFAPFSDGRTGAVTIVIAANRRLPGVSAGIRGALQPRFPDTPIVVRSLDSQIDRALARERLMATLTTTFGAVALILAVVGIYGVLAHNVGSRTIEIAIRSALGSEPAAILRLVLRDAIQLLALGIVVGAPIALAVSQLVASMLFGFEGVRVSVIATASTALVAAGVIASVIPAVRAAGIDPAIALREP